MKARLRPKSQIRNTDKEASIYHLLPDLPLLLYPGCAQCLSSPQVLTQETGYLPQAREEPADDSTLLKKTNLSLKREKS